MTRTYVHKTEGNRSKLKCPKCGEQLLSGEGLVWCSNVGSRVNDSCGFGVSSHVTRSQFLKERAKRLEGE